MKTAALDIGDKWIGVALSDALGMLARPYETVESSDLLSFLPRLIENEQVTTILVGHPKTLRGTDSEQTKKVVKTAQELEKQFPQVTWKLWDERLTSKQASRIKQTKTKEQKRRSHAIAAALILESYLTYLQFHADEQQ